MRKIINSSDDQDREYWIGSRAIHFVSGENNDLVWITNEMPEVP